MRVPYFSDFIGLADLLSSPAVLPRELNLIRSGGCHCPNCRTIRKIIHPSFSFSPTRNTRSSFCLPFLHYSDSIRGIISGSFGSLLGALRTKTPSAGRVHIHGAHQTTNRRNHHVQYHSLDSLALRLYSPNRHSGADRGVSTIGIRVQITTNSSQSIKRGPANGNGQREQRVKRAATAEEPAKQSKNILKPRPANRPANTLFPNNGNER